MAYEKTEWKNGDTITAEKLNHMEDGIAEGGGSGGELLVVNAVPRESQPSYYILDKTFGEILEAYKSGIPIMCNVDHQHTTFGYIEYTFVPQEGEEQGYGSGTVNFGIFDFYAYLSEGPYTEERFFAEYPYADFS